MSTHKSADSASKLDRVVLEARRAREKRESDYRALALKLYPWVCGRCGREFTRENLTELTVHHRNHDHDFNPPDGSNWELLCLYCHDNEHMRLVEAAQGHSFGTGKRASPATDKPFAGLADLLRKPPG
ncbi:MAG: HNH nuclease family protein [Gammaproteobacteria bacterium]|nr:HNH nuclease family protein [Gammaproteobacteria bacterium]